MDAIGSCDLDLITRLGLLAFTIIIVSLIRQLVSKDIPQVPHKSIEAVQLRLSFREMELIHVTLDLLLVKPEHLGQEVANLSLVLQEATKLVIQIPHVPDGVLVQLDLVLILTVLDNHGDVVLVIMDQLEHIEDLVLRTRHIDQLTVLVLSVWNVGQSLEDPLSLRLQLLVREV